MIEKLGVLDITSMILQQIKQLLKVKIFAFRLYK